MVAIKRRRKQYSVIVDSLYRCNIKLLVSGQLADNIEDGLLSKNVPDMYICVKDRDMTGM